MQDFRERCRHEQLCCQKVADQVDELFEKERALGIANVGAVNAKYLVIDAPIIGLLYSAIDDELIAELKALTCRGLATWARFHRSKPSGFPDLPLSFDAGQKMICDRDPRVALVGYYGHSQLMAKWDEEHPSFNDFCRGLLACKHAPKRLRELRWMFPPKPLEGLPDDEGLYWRTPETLRAWCNLMARCDASVMRELDDPNYHAVVAERAESLFRQVTAS
jgi:hypothetical protein